VNSDVATLEELLAEGFEAQADCYRQAVELLSEWLTTPKQDLQELVAVLEQQQRLVNQATEIDETLAEARARWQQTRGANKPGPRLQRALDRLRQTIDRLIGLNDVLRTQAMQARDQVRAELDRLSTGEKASRAYGRRSAERAAVSRARRHR